MGVITLKIDDQLEKRLRRRVGEGGAARGALSRGVEEALSQWLGVTEEVQMPRVFLAIRQGKKLEEDSSLGGLADKLRKRNVDVRDVTIESVPEPPTVVRMGMRLSPPRS